jgi:hypothetical protein
MARGTSEPAPAEPTAAPEAINVSEEAPEEATELATANNVEESEELEPEEELASSPESNVDDDLFVEYKGREINLKDVEEWEQGSLRQSDYTRKTQDLAEQRKAFEEERQQFTAKAGSLDTQMATLEAIISESTLSAEDVAELREYDPEAYIKHTEKMSKRQDILAKAKTAAGSPDLSGVDVPAERKKLWEANPSWMKEGKQTDKFKKDMDLLQSYAAERNFSDAKINKIVMADDWVTHLHAARYLEMVKKSSSIEKRVRTAPVTTKPRQATQTSVQSKLKAAQAKLAKTGHVDDAVAVRKLKRKLQE